MQRKAKYFIIQTKRRYYEPKKTQSKLIIKKYSIMNKNQEKQTMLIMKGKIIN